MKNYTISLAVLALLIMGVSIAGAFPGQTAACDTAGCHTISSSIIVTANVTSTLTVSPGQIFDVGIDYSGGLSPGTTEVNWPNVLNNTQFSPTPRVPVPANTATSGTTSSVLTAPLTTGLYDVKVYASSGFGSPDGTNFTVVSISVQEPVVVPVLETITVSPSNATLSIGDTQVFIATALDQNGAPMGGINVEWTSSNTSVGNVSPVAAMTDANGTATTTFTAIANGTSMVNATNGSVMGSANVTVSEVVITPVLETITVSPSTATLSVGDTQVFTATALDQNGAPMEGINIEWTSSDTSVGNVSPDDSMTGADGKATTTFTAIANGTSMVNATNGSVVGSADVVVSEEIGEVNLIKNPGFESGKQNWIFYTNGTGKFNIISPGFEGNNSAEVILGKIGSNMQLYQKGITLKPNTHYKLSFAAKSSRGHDVRVVLLKHGSPFTNYGLKQNFNLTKDWQTFTTEFDTKGFAGTVDDGRLMFYLTPFAKAGDKYFFDSVVLEEETE